MVERSGMEAIPKGHLGQDIEALEGRAVVAESSEKEQRKSYQVCAGMMLLECLGAGKKHLSTCSVAAAPLP